MLFGAAYYPEHRSRDRWDYDLETMKKMSVNALRVGEFAWKRFEPRDGEFDFRWMDDFCERARKQGIALLMCTPLRTAPDWLVHLDPSISIVTDSGLRLSYGTRYSFCINHPLLREKGVRLAQTMARHYARQENVIGWHLDNEHGDEPDCHCEICTAKWHQWLQQRYATPDALNKAWGTVFWGMECDAFDRVPTPRVSKTWHNPAHTLAWRRFRSDCTIEMIAKQADAVRGENKKAVITTNFQPVWNYRTDFYEAQAHLDVCGTNHYPEFGTHSRGGTLGLANTRSFKQGAFHVHELRNSAHAIPGLGGNTPGPGEIERLSLDAVANGAEALFFFRWRACPFGVEQTHGTITDYDGRPRRAYHELAPVGKKLVQLAGLIDGTEVRSEAAVLYDYPSRWATEIDDFWHGLPRLFLDYTEKTYLRLHSQGINCDTVGRTRDFGDYKLLVVPNLSVVDDAVVEKLVSFVKLGGVLVWHPLAGTRDMEASVFSTRLHPRLRELLGIDVQEYATGGEGEYFEIEWEDRRYRANHFFDQPVPFAARSLAAYVDCWFAGTPSLTVNEFGAGKAYHIAAFMDDAFYDTLFSRLVDEAGIERLLGYTPPESVEVVCRSHEDGRRLVFVLNHSDEPRKIELGLRYRDVYSEQDVEGTCELAGHGVRILTPLSAPDRTR